MDRTRLVALLQFYDPERAVSEEWWFPLQSLRMAEEIAHTAPVGRTDADTRTALREDLLAAEMRLGRFYARDAIISLLNNWPTTSPLSLEVLGGPANFLKALRLIAKAYLAQPIPDLRQAGEDGSAAGDIMHILWAQLQRLCR